MALKKSGISPLNPNEVSDGMLAPAKVFKPSSDIFCASSSSASLASPTFSDKQIALHKERFREGYDVHDPQYELWAKETHPGSSEADSMKTHQPVCIRGVIWRSQ